MIQKRLDKVTGYLYRIEFEYSTGKYFIIASLPIHWIVKNQDGVQIEHLNTFENISNFFKLSAENLDDSFENLLLIIKHNSKLDDIQAKAKAKIAQKKNRISQEELDIVKIVDQQKQQMLREFEEELKKEHEQGKTAEENFGGTEDGLQESDGDRGEFESETSDNRERLEEIGGRE